MQMLNLAHIKGPSDISEKDTDVWNRAAEIDLEISYKLVEQLMAYYNDWKANLNIKQKLSLTFENQRWFMILSEIHNALYK